MQTLPTAAAHQGRFYIDILSGPHSNAVSKLVVLAIVFPVYLISVVIAVASYNDAAVGVGLIRKFVFRALPYGIAIAVALFLARSGDGWDAIVLEAALYSALTWVIVWGVRKQWYG